MMIKYVAISERIPRNTTKSTNWGNSVFEAWCFERDIDKKPVDMTDGELNKYISWFVHDPVKQDGCSPYPPNSLYQIVVAIQQHLKESGLFFNGYILIPTLTNRHFKLIYSYQSTINI